MIRILFVCTGNLCRSPIAEALFQSKLIASYPRLTPFIEACSAGTSAIEGNPATSSAIQAMDLWGIDLEPHRASQLSPARLGEADLIITMARDHLLALQRMQAQALEKSTTINHLASVAVKINRRLGDEAVRSEQEARARISDVLQLLREFSTADGFLADIQSRGSDIIDPIGSSLQVYLEVAEDIDLALDRAMHALFGRPEKVAER